MSNIDPEQDKKERSNKDAAATTSASTGKGEAAPSGARSDARPDKDEPEQDDDSSRGVLAEQRPPDDS